MSFKEKALAALDAFKNDSLGIVAATIEDCQELIRGLPEDGGEICAADSTTRPEVDRGRITL